MFLISLLSILVGYFLMLLGSAFFNPALIS